MQIIIFANPDDPTRVSIMYPTGELPIDELIRRHIDTSKPYQVMDPSDIPHAEGDGDYFEAWQMTPKDGVPGRYEVMVNLERAKRMHRDRLRLERKERLEALDVAFMRAVERGDTEEQRSIAIKKQQLRDIPNHPAISAAASTADLRSLTVDVLVSIT